ncbi:DUF3221 domain-containing protein [Cellulosilyticum sp. ST5]|uniref:DUF3221 domain-containing protein n=1 Tax=unclassified Cellulosilyticum TaxID=2643091 RepID=UPI000F8ECCE9|nr:DUF3221 domain-containing protein [Cellulosilyticum sp. WCF-2]QEH70090.1 hypothetical protein EKH84_17495 [Cellulosilyticum sp. WCF-2]
MVKKSRLKTVITGISLLLMILIVIIVARTIKQNNGDNQQLDLVSQGDKVIAKIYDSQQAIYNEEGQVPNAIYHFSKEQLIQLAEMMNFKDWKADKGNMIYDMALSLVIQVNDKDCYYVFPNVENQTYIEIYDTSQSETGSKRYFAPKEVYETVKGYIMSQGALVQGDMENSLTAEITEVKDQILLVKGIDEAALKSIGDACYLTINKASTTILDSEGQKVNLSYLKTGMQIKIKLLGGILESYPCQAETLVVQVIQ